MPRLEDEMKTQFGSETNKVFPNIVFTGNWISSKSDAFIKPFGLSFQQFNVLRILRGAKDWLAMNEVKNRMVEKSPNTTRLCDKLLDKNLIERVRCEEDRRVVHLKISEMGLELLAKIDKSDYEAHMGFVNNITEEEAAVVNKILDKLRD